MFENLSRIELSILRTINLLKRQRIDWDSTKDWIFNPSKSVKVLILNKMFLIIITVKQIKRRWYTVRNTVRDPFDHLFCLYQDWCTLKIDTFSVYLTSDLFIY